MLAKAQAVDRARVYRESILPYKLTIDLAYVNHHGVLGDLALLARTLVLPLHQIGVRMVEGLPGPLVRGARACPPSGSPACCSLFTTIYAIEAARARLSGSAPARDVAARDADARRDGEREAEEQVGPRLRGRRGDRGGLADRRGSRPGAVVRRCARGARAAAGPAVRCRRRLPCLPDALDACAPGTFEEDPKPFSERIGDVVPPARRVADRSAASAAGPSRRRPRCRRPRCRPRRRRRRVAPRVVERDLVDDAGRAALRRGRQTERRGGRRSGGGGHEQWPAPTTCGRKRIRDNGRHLRRN